MGGDVDGERLDVAAALHLAGEPASVAKARRFIADFCRAAELPAEICETASLLVSELVTNAVIHGRTSATIDAHRPGDELRVTVHDDNPSLPPAGAQPTLSAESGRGLQIVSLLATDWGVEARADGGKSVWFTLST